MAIARKRWLPLVVVLELLTVVVGFLVVLL